MKLVFSLIFLQYVLVTRAQFEDIEKIFEESRAENQTKETDQTSTPLSLEPFTIDSNNEIPTVTEKLASLDPFKPSSNKTDCKFECVPFYQCNNGTLNQGGETIIDIRINDGPCGNAFLSCCQHDHVMTETTTSPPFIPKGCGYRNPDGVGFQITGTKENESQFAEFPWVVSINRDIGTTVFKSRPSCGGALIHPQAVITAAHCVADTNERYMVRAGDWDILSSIEPYPHQVVSVESVTVHKDYYSGSLYNDIAFLYLKDPIKLAENINTVCLPPQNYEHRQTRCLSTGWGRERFGGNYQKILKKIDLPFVPRDVCQDNLRKTRLGKFFVLHSSFMCAGGEKDKDSCNGDGGSPLMCPIDGEEWRYYHAGIVAWGIGCGGENIPGVYVDVAKFRDWIDNEMDMRSLNKSSYDQNTGLEPRIKKP